MSTFPIQVMISPGRREKNRDEGEKEQREDCKPALYGRRPM